MKDENYIIIQGWMISKLELKGNELLIYAIIYGFSQDGESTFYGSISFIEKMLNISRKTVIETLKSLIEKQYVERVETSKYRALKHTSVKTTLVEKLHQTSVETTPVASVEITPNIYNNKYNILQKVNDLTLTPPKKKEIVTKTYIQEDYIKTMITSNDKRMKIIAWWINKKNLDISSKEKIENIIKRNLIVSKNLLPYSSTELEQAYKKCLASSKGEYDVKLETLLKKLTT